MSREMCIRDRGIIDQVVAGYPSGYNDYALIYFPDFVEVYGQDECHWDLSMAAIEPVSYTHLFSRKIR